VDYGWERVVAMTGDWVDEKVGRIQESGFRVQGEVGG
jgi:hypothetical protein